MIEPPASGPDCDAYVPDVELGEHYLTSSPTLYAAVERVFDVITATPTPPALPDMVYFALGLLIENRDIAAWATCAKVPRDRVWVDGDHTEAGNTAAWAASVYPVALDLILSGNAANRIPIFIIREDADFDGHPWFENLRLRRDAHASRNPHLPPVSVAAYAAGMGMTAEAVTGYSSVDTSRLDPTVPTSDYPNAGPAIFIYALHPLIHTAAQVWQARGDAPQATCIYALVAGIILHELIHVMRGNNPDQENPIPEDHDTHTDATGTHYRTCDPFELIENHFIWAMSQRYFSDDPCCRLHWRDYRSGGTTLVVTWHDLYNRVASPLFGRTDAPDCGATLPLQESHISQEDWRHD